MSNKSIETVFQIVAVIFLGVAAFFLQQGNYEGVFVSGVLSSASYFLSFRFQVKERLDRREAERKERELDDLHMNRSLLRGNSGLFDIEPKELDNQAEKIPFEK